jgi:hypothetical protein
VGTIEVIAACGFGNTITGPYSRSFASSLIFELREMAAMPSFPVTTLFRRVSSRIAQAPAIDRSTATPMHISLGRTIQNQSITLMPFDPRENDLVLFGDLGLKNRTKWGPLGPLPAGWEKAIDNDDQ